MLELDVNEVVFWGRNEDDTGSIHPCWHTDRGAVAFIRSDFVEAIVGAAWAEIEAHCILEDSHQIRIRSQLETVLRNYREETSIDNFHTEF